jgi:hypothetical protein
MSIVRATILTLLLLVPTTLAAPALAAPNDGRYKKSSEAMKKEWEGGCALYKDMVDLAEREADKRAGTKAAEKYAKEADSWWAAGEAHGCAWAK